jgi:hypothetical protein
MIGTAGSCPGSRFGMGHKIGLRIDGLTSWSQEIAWNIGYLSS